MTNELHLNLHIVKVISKCLHSIVETIRVKLKRDHHLTSTDRKHKMR